MDKDRQFVTSLGRGLQVRRAFSRKAGGLSNGQLVRLGWRRRPSPPGLRRSREIRLALGGETFDALEHPNTAGIGRAGRRI
jgi:hypothetical protein